MIKGRGYKDKIVAEITKQSNKTKILQKTSPVSTQLRKYNTFKFFSIVNPQSYPASSPPVKTQKKKKMFQLCNDRILLPFQKCISTSWSKKEIYRKRRKLGCSTLLPKREQEVGWKTTACRTKMFLFLFYATRINEYVNKKKTGKYIGRTTHTLLKNWWYKKYSTMN